MAKSRKSEDVPKTMEAKFNAIVKLTDEFAQQHLDDEYAQLIRQATAALCRKRPSPLDKGQEKTWACGITHAIGIINFLFDSSNSPHISAKELYQWFGVADSTGQSKSKLVRDTLKMRQFDSNWCLPSKMDDNPLIWMLSVNGFFMDIRNAPLGAQIEAYRKGLIPYIPGHKENSEEIANVLSAPAFQTPGDRRNPKSAKRKTKTAKLPPSPEALQALYVLEVSLLDGLLTDEFIQKNPQVIRTIEIRGDQTLADLHDIIFQAFNRSDEHLYEFQLKGKGPNDPDADCYGLPMDAFDAFDDKVVEDATQTQIGALGLTTEECFGYWFDFGDDWWHQVGVLAVTKPQPKVKYPRITKRVGASPPQYPEL
jgi:hypothetical protein